MTITTLSIGERANLEVYVLLAILMSSLLFPVAASWVWSNGWLKQLGFKDTSGSGIVFLLGGVSGFCGTLVLGPRMDIFSVINKRIKRGNLKNKKKSKVEKAPEIDIENNDEIRKKSLNSNHMSILEGF